GFIVAQRAVYPGANAAPAAASPTARPGLDTTAWPLSDPLAVPRAHRGLSVAARLSRDWIMLALAAPGIAFFLVFYYLPLLGYVIAFQDYQPFLGFDSPYVGIKNFTDMMKDARFWQAVRNTLQITIMQLVLYFPAPICVALMLNSIMSVRIRR